MDHPLLLAALSLALGLSVPGLRHWLGSGPERDGGKNSGELQASLCQLRLCGLSRSIDRYVVFLRARERARAQLAEQGQELNLLDLQIAEARAHLKLYLAEWRRRGAGQR